MTRLPHRPPRRGCVRGCAGCLFHHPLTVLLTGIALVFLMAQLVRAGLALATARPLPLGALVGTTLLVILAQLGPRLVALFWWRWCVRQAEAAAVAPPSRRWWHWRSFALDGTGLDGRADGRLGRDLRDPRWWTGAAASGEDGPDPAAVDDAADWRTWRDHRDALWVADADASTYHEGDDPAAVAAMIAAPAPGWSRGVGVSATRRLAMLRHLDAEAGIVMIDPSADPPFRPLLEDPTHE